MKMLKHFDSYDCLLKHVYRSALSRIIYLYVYFYMFCILIRLLQSLYFKASVCNSCNIKTIKRKKISKIESLKGHVTQQCSQVAIILYRIEIARRIRVCVSDSSRCTVRYLNERSGQKSKFAGHVRRQRSHVHSPRSTVRHLNEDSQQRSKNAYNVQFF